MYNCFDIAKFFIKLASDEGKIIDPMKLLKLTYIAQGYYLGFFDKPLYYNNVQAWKYGPVIPELYAVIKRFGLNAVDFDLVDLYSENDLKEIDKKFLEYLWTSYKTYSGLSLSSLTHKDNSPWHQVYKENEMNTVIPNEIIKDYYKDLIKSKNNGQRST